MTANDSDSDATTGDTDPDDAGEPSDEPPTGDGRLSDPEPITGEHPGGPRRDEPPFPAVAAAVREQYADDSTGHDVHHVWRVFRLGHLVADRLDEDVDREVLGAAALVHDLHRVLGEGVEPEESLDAVEAALQQADFPPAKVEAVLHCVAVHDDYAYRGDPDRTERREARILQDADNLDAVGAVGIARTFAFGGANGTPLWDPDGEDYSQLYHFEDKLLRLDEELNTAPAREIAAGRIAFLEEFRERFLREWHGEA